IAHSARASSATRSGAPMGSALLDLLEVDDEDERLVRGDVGRRALGPVAEVGRDRQLAAPADAHAGDALVPALDDLALAQWERERLAAGPRGIETLAVAGAAADALPGDRWC